MPNGVVQLNNKFINIHIPKTAGSTFRTNLAYAMGIVHRGKHHLIGVDRGHDHKRYFDGLKGAFKDQLPGILNEGIQVMSGHYRYRDVVKALTPIRGQVSLVTFVRDPAWRMISDYYYSISDRHNASDVFIATYPRFDDYLQNQGQLNKQLDYLCPFEGASVEETIENALFNLDFIGVTENFESDFETLMTAASVEFEIQSPENVNPDRDQMHDAHNKYQDQLRSLLMHEYELYDAILKHRNLPL